jgi:tetratricopeptide (TPR) repeat protein
MLSCAKFHDSRAEAWREWDQWIKNEQNLLKRRDQNTNSRIVSTLIDQQLDWAAKLGDTTRLIAEMQKAYRTQRGGHAGAPELIEWLAKHEAWKPLKTTPSVFIRSFALGPRVKVYALAQRYREMGQKALAEEAARKAFEFEHVVPGHRHRSRVTVGNMLQQGGHFKWAEREYRQAISSAASSEDEVYQASTILAEMLHDRQQHAEAAKVLQSVVDRLKKQLSETKASPMLNLRLRSLMSTIDYYLACEWKWRKDRQKQRAFVDAGLAIDPTSVDLLIAAYRLSDGDDVYRRRIEELIAKAIEQLKVKIVGGTDHRQRDRVRNELAWLEASTNRNLDEAIRLVREALRRNPRSGGMYDTLARAYQAKGDYKRAVKYQNRAVELEPHCGAIARHLKTMRTQYKKKYGKPAPKPSPSKSRWEPDYSSGSRVRFQTELPPGFE